MGGGRCTPKSVFFFGGGQEPLSASEYAYGNLSLAPYMKNSTRSFWKFIYMIKNKNSNKGTIVIMMYIIVLYIAKRYANSKPESEQKIKILGFHCCNLCGTPSSWQDSYVRGITTLGSDTTRLLSLGREINSISNIMKIIIKLITNYIRIYTWSFYNRIFLIKDTLVYFI